MLTFERNLRDIKYTVAVVTSILYSIKQDTILNQVNNNPREI